MVNIETPTAGDLQGRSCGNIPKGTPALTGAELHALASAVPEWQIVDQRAIEREYSCTTYMDGVRWFALVAAIAEQEDHHPDATITWCKVKLMLWTHTVGGLSENDFILAAKLERAWQEFCSR
jgi:4a-hydroxytetrahydrobiopterin dehydratase